MTVLACYCSTFFPLAKVPNTGRTAGALPRRPARGTQPLWTPAARSGCAPSVGAAFAWSGAAWWLSCGSHTARQARRDALPRRPARGTQPLWTPAARSGCVLSVGAAFAWGGAAWWLSCGSHTARQARRDALPRRPARGTQPLWTPAARSGCVPSVGAAFAWGGAGVAWRLPCGSHAVRQARRDTVLLQKGSLSEGARAIDTLRCR